MKPYVCKIFLLFLLTSGLTINNAAVASEYIYRNLMGNTLRPEKCATRADAEQRATDPYTVEKFTKRFCETQGYGWYLEERKTAGKLVCDACAGNESSNNFKCRIEDITVECKRLKPGSAGLIPGKS